MGIEGLDPILHERVRLGILVLLVQAGELDFQTLKRALGVTDGNLAQHLRVLEEAGVIHARKGFQGRRPRTVYQLTESGRRRFEQYLEALRGLLGPLSGGQP
jgi:DNA-binding HxlR family transcriptional regulator